MIEKFLDLKRRKLLKSLLEKAKDIRASQTALLLEKVRRNEDSGFGKAFGFKSIRTFRDFSSQLPLAEYDLFEPYIERLKTGDVRALFGPQEKLLMFALTSGTTGRAKYIPVTESFLKEYREGSLFWAACLANEFRGLPRGHILPIYSPMEEERTPSGYPCGAISGLIAKNQGCLIGSLYAAPFAVSNVRSSRTRLYGFLRSAAERSVTLMITANPSTLLNFAKILEEESGRLLADLADGTLEGQKAPYRLRRLPKRSGELKKILEEKGALKPRDLWPNLQVLACWKGGTLFHYLKHLPEYYGNTLLKDIGLLASEGRFSFPVIPDVDAGILNIFHHFYEFIPEEEEDSAAPRTLLAHELEKGKRYFLVITTSSGLYRYKIHDLVEVRGFFHGIPLIYFLNKGRHIASLTGEKLTEHQVLTAVHDAAAGLNIDLSHFRLLPRWDDPPYYLMLAEREDRFQEPEKFLRALDAKFQSLNVEYASKRSSGRLGVPRLVWVKEGTFSRIQSRSHRPEQFKPVYLDPDPENFAQYSSEIIEN